jgi:hypothetical protein
MEKRQQIQDSGAKELGTGIPNNFAKMFGIPIFSRKFSFTFSRKNVWNTNNFALSLDFHETKFREISLIFAFCENPKIHFRFNSTPAPSY